MRLDLPDFAAWFLVKSAPDGLPVRHRVFHGGRGGGKSWAAAAMTVVLAWSRPRVVLCAREYQNSIADSSKKTIEDWIVRLGLADFFISTETEIRCLNGSIIKFVGLHGREASIKSFEGVDLVWIDEASTILQASIDALIPTIRRAGSELWWTYNPRYPNDPVDRMFRAGNLPPGTICVPIGFRDNPWLPKELQRQIDYDRVRDPEKYAHVWEGDYVRRSDALIFSRVQVVSFNSPQNASFLLGADFGATSPTVLVRCFAGRWGGAPGAAVPVADPRGSVLFIDYEAYRANCQLDEIPALFAGTCPPGPVGWPNPKGLPGIPNAARLMIRGDSARLDVIRFLQQRGFNIVPAIKGPGSVAAGIARLSGKDIVVHPRCVRTIAELASYRWQTDRLTDELLDVPIDENNHAIDALRYATEQIDIVQPDYSMARSGGRRLMLPDENNADSRVGLQFPWAPAHLQDRIRRSFGPGW